MHMRGKSRLRFLLFLSLAWGVVSLAASITSFAREDDVRQAAAAQVSDTQIRRFGTVGRSLSESEVTQIVRLANAAGKAPWLVLGFPSMVSGVTRLRVYLEPDVTTERLRRGCLLELVAKDTPGVSQRSEWAVESTASYAYVPGATAAGEIASERDLGWPFAIHGDIDDESLISLVNFVRSRPPLPNVREGSAPREVPSAPILGIWRRGETFDVGLRLREDTETFGVTVIKQDGQWVVTKWNWAIV